MKKLITILALILSGCLPENSQADSMDYYNQQQGEQYANEQEQAYQDEKDSETQQQVQETQKEVAIQQKEIDGQPLSFGEQMKLAEMRQFH